MKLNKILVFALGMILLGCQYIVYDQSRNRYFLATHHLSSDKYKSFFEKDCEEKEIYLNSIPKNESVTLYLTKLGGDCDSQNNICLFYFVSKGQSDNKRYLSIDGVYKSETNFWRYNRNIRVHTYPKEYFSSQESEDDFTENNKLTELIILDKAKPVFYGDNLSCYSPPSFSERDKKAIFEKTKNIRKFLIENHYINN